MREVTPALDPRKVSVGPIGISTRAEVVTGGVVGGQDLDRGQRVSFEQPGQASRADQLGDLLGVDPAGAAHRVDQPPRHAVLPIVVGALRVVGAEHDVLDQPGGHAPLVRQLPRPSQPDRHQRVRAGRAVPLQLQACASQIGGIRGGLDGCRGWTIDPFQRPPGSGVVPGR